MNLDLISPQPCKVVELFKQDNTAVKRGDLLIRLSPGEDGGALSDIQEKLKKARAHLAHLSPEYVKLKTQELLSAKNLTSSILNSRQLILDDGLVSFRLGTTDHIHICPLAQAFATAGYDSIMARIRADEFSKNVPLVINHLNTIIQMLEQSKVIYERRIERLLIKAPANGSFRSFVTLGSPASRGMLIARIESAA